MSNDSIIKTTAKSLNISEAQVSTVIKLLSEGATIPFIARYRKEMTNYLDENQIRDISQNYEYQQNLSERKETVINLINEKGMLTPELKEAILACSKMSEVDAIYEPYKESRKTKGTEAIKMGLEPLAKKIMKFPRESREELAKPFLNDQVKKGGIMASSYVGVLKLALDSGECVPDQDLLYPVIVEVPDIYIIVRAFNKYQILPPDGKTHFIVLVKDLYVCFLECVFVLFQFEPDGSQFAHLVLPDKIHIAHYIRNEENQYGFYEHSPESVREISARIEGCVLDYGVDENHGKDLAHYPDDIAPV